MLWLAKEAELPERTGGQHGIDDFAQRFYEGAAPVAPTSTYTFEDICQTLGEVVPADWERLLRGWIEAHDELDTSSGLTRYGWRLTFTEVPTAALRASEDGAGVSDLTYSIGAIVRDDGVIRAVAWNGPTFRARMRPGIRIVAVNQTPFKRDDFLSAVRSSAGRPVGLTLERDGARSEVRIPYAGPLRYPRLERIAGRPDTLAALFARRQAATGDH